MSSPDTAFSGAQAAERDVAKAVAAFQDDGGFFFWGGGRDTQLRLLGHLVRYSDLLLVLTAPRGAGKTTLIRAFMQSDTTGLQAWLLQAQEFMHADALWAQLCASAGTLRRSLGAAPGGRVEALRQFAADCRADNTVGVLLVDDAHLLAEDALEFLCDASVALRDAESLRIVLSGEQKLQEHLEHSRLIDRVQGNCHHFTLEALDAGVAEDYLGQRLGKHGMTTDIFAAGELRFILTQGRGLPGEMDAAAVRVLRSGMPAEGARNFPVIPRAHLIAIASVLVLILGTYLLTGPDSTEDDSPAAGTLAQPAVKRIIAPKIVNARPELDRELKVGDGLAALPVAEQAALAPIPVPKKVAGVATAGAANVGAADADSVSAPGRVPEASKTPEAEPLTDQSLVAEAQPVATTNTLAPDILPVGEPPPDVAPSPERERMEDFLANRKPQQRTEGWLLEQSPGSYTVQVLGAGNEQAVAKFIEKQERPEDFIYFRTTLKGRDWFVVVIGLYANRAEAVASIRALPQSLRKNRPWARSLESIHKAIVEDRPA